MKTNIKKTLKFITLLLSALLIGTASAAVYNYMQINATVGVKGFDVNFYDGDDTATAGGTISSDRQTVTFDNIEGLAGQIVNYTDLVRICNNGTSAHNLNLEITSDTYNGNAASTLDYIKITVYNSGGTSVDTLQLDPHGDDGGDDKTTDFQNLAGSNDWWRVQLKILWFSNATVSDSVNIALQITVEN